MRAGGEYFLEPAEAVQRRYEALRCYFVEDASAESVGARFGYSPATVHQRAAERSAAASRSCPAAAADLCGRTSRRRLVLPHNFSVTEIPKRSLPKETRCRPRR